MVEWHDYSPNNISSCQECKDLHDKYKDEDGQVEDYHEEVPIGEKTFSQRYNIYENKKKGTKRGYDASISNLNRGDNVQFKKGNFGNSQLDNLEVHDDDEDETKDNKYGGRKRRTRRKKTNRKRKTKTHKKKTHRKRKTMKKRRN